MKSNQGTQKCNKNTIVSHSQLDRNPFELSCTINSSVYIFIATEIFYLKQENIVYAKLQKVIESLNYND